MVVFCVYVAAPPTAVEYVLQRFLSLRFSVEDDRWRVDATLEKKKNARDFCFRPKCPRRRDDGPGIRIYLIISRSSEYRVPVF